MIFLDVALPVSPVTLAIGLGGSIGVVAAALALGIRHGIDWDHIAAITDITSSTATAEDPSDRWLVREPGLLLTDESHHTLADPERHRELAEAESVVVASAIVPATAAVGHSHGGSSVGHFPDRAPSAGAGPMRRFSSLIPEQKRALFLGTLYALGHGTVVVLLGLLAILARRFLPENIDPIMERVVGVTLLLLAAYLFYSLYRYFRGGGEFRIVSRWMLLFASVRNAFSWLRSKLSGDHPHEHVRGVDRYGPHTAYSVGLVHGIGAETGTQVLVIATAVGAATKAMGVAALFAFVAGLLISNSFVTVATTVGFVSSRRRKEIYVGAGLLAAVFSLVVGLVFLFHATGFLPDLDPYFRWIGGPDA